MLYFFQIMSIEQLPHRITNLTWKNFFASIGVSLFLTMAVRWAVNAEQISANVGGSKYEDMNYGLEVIAFNSSMYIFIAFVSMIFMFIISEIFSRGAPSILDTISRKSVLELILVFLLYTILAGVVGSLVSSIFLLRYESLSVTRGARSWFRRLRFYFSIVTGDGSHSLGQALEGRWPHCCSRKLVSETTDDRLICQVCGSYRGIHRPEARVENDDTTLPPQQQD